MKIKNLLLIISFFVMLYFILCFFYLPNLIQKEIINYIQKNYSKNVSIQETLFNPLSLKADIKNLSIEGKDSQKLFFLERFKINLEALDILSHKINFKNIEFINPTLYIFRDKDKNINILDLLSKSDDENSSNDINITVQNTKIINATVLFEDNSSNKPFKLKIDNLNYQIDNLNTQGEKIDQKLRFNIQNKGFLEIENSFKLDNIEFSGHLNMKNITLKKLNGYFNNFLLLNVAGRSDIDIYFDYKDKNFFINNSQINFKDLILYKNKKEIKIDNLNINNLFLNLQNQSINISTISLDNAKLLEIDFLKNNNTQNSKPNWNVNIKNIILNNTSFVSNKEEIDILAIINLHIKDTNYTNSSLYVEELNILNSALKLKKQNKNLIKKEIKKRLSKEFNYVINKTSIKNTDIKFYDYDKDLNLNSFIKEANSSKISNINNKKIDFSLLALIEKAPLNLDGSFENDSFKIKANIKNFNTQKFNFILKDKSYLSINKGYLSIKSDIFYNDSISLNNTYIGVSKLSLSQDKKPFLNVKEIKINNLNFNQKNLLLDISSINLSNAILYTTLNQNNEINILKIIKNNSKNSRNKNKLKIKIDKMETKESQIDFEDIKNNTKTKITNINMQIKNLIDDKFKIQLESILNDSKISFSSNIVINPLNIDSQVSINKLDLKNINPYIKEYVNFLFSSGKLSIDSKIKFNQSISFENADITIDDLALDDLNKNTFFASSKILIDRLSFKNKKLNIFNIKLLSPYSDIKIDKNGILNLSNLIKQQKEKNSKENSFEFFIKNINFENLVTQYTDNSLSKIFEININNTNGQIADISSSKDIISEINIEGGIQRYGYLKINGKFDFKKIKKYSNLYLIIKNIPLNLLNGYAIKYLGYELLDGKGSIYTKYIVDNANLNVDNQLIIKDIKLGLKVDNSKELSIPLAISILQDSNNIINLKLPIKGNLSTPNFEYSNLIMETLTKKVVSIVSLPVRIITGIFGTDSKINEIEFEAGEAKFNPPEEEKLKEIVKILNKKNKTIIQITPSYNPKKDTFALAEKIYKEKLKKELFFDWNINEEKMQETYKKLFIKEFGEQRLEEIKQTQNDKIKLANTIREELIKNQKISTLILQELANKRVQLIKNFLLSQKIERNRINITTLQTNNKNTNIKINMKYDLQLLMK